MKSLKSIESSIDAISEAFEDLQRKHLDTLEQMIKDKKEHLALLHDYNDLLKKYRDLLEKDNQHIHTIIDLKAKLDEATKNAS